MFNKLVIAKHINSTYFHENCSGFCVGHEYNLVVRQGKDGRVVILVQDCDPELGVAAPASTVRG